MMRLIPGAFAMKSAACVSQKLTNLLIRGLASEKVLHHWSVILAVG